MLSTLEITQKRRDKLSIIADILDITQTRALKTQIMYKANLSFAQLNEYITYMKKTGLLKQYTDSGKEIYTITPKGLDYMQRHQELTQLLKLQITNNTVKLPPSKYLKN
jgi:predicted transcriptional regulator